MRAFCWLILVPRQADLSELVDLDARDRAILMEEIAAVSEVLRALPDVDKINVGALGNIVRQLHIHVVARRIGDAAWPGPVWGAGAPQRYEAPQRREIVARSQRAIESQAGMTRALRERAGRD